MFWPSAVIQVPERRGRGRRCCGCCGCCGGCAEDTGIVRSVTGGERLQTARFSVFAGDEPARHCARAGEGKKKKQHGRKEKRRTVGNCNGGARATTVAISCAGLGETEMRVSLPPEETKKKQGRCATAAKQLSCSGRQWGGDRWTNGPLGGWAVAGETSRGSESREQH